MSTFIIDTKDAIKKALMALCLVLLLSPACSGGSGGGGSSEEDTAVPDNAAVLSASGDFGAIMVNSAGETLLPKVTRDANGAATAIAGVLWTDASGGSYDVDYGADGLPTQAVAGNYVLLFTNWDTDAQTVDIAKVYAPTGYIEIFRGVSTASASANAAKVLKGAAAANPAKMTCFPACDSDAKNLAELLRIAGLGLSLGGCAVATTISFGAAALPCAGLIVATATTVIDSDVWLENLGYAGEIFAHADAFQCGLGDASACVSTALEVGARTLDIADAVTTNYDDTITTANVFVTDPATPAGVAQDGDLPACTVATVDYECTDGTYMPCYPEGVKECGADCHWGSCNYETCGDGACDGTFAGETYTNCPADCDAPTCGDGVCASGEASSCPSDCQVDSCCATTNNCPGETAYECADSCCCCPYGARCSTDSVCSSS